MKAARTVRAVSGMAMLLATAACSSSDPSDEGAVPVRPATTTLVPTSTTTTRPATPVSTTVTTAAPRPSTTQAPEPVWTRFTSAKYKVALAYPPDWSEPADSTAAAPNFFALNAASGGGQSLAQLCRGTATHTLRPFGSNPVINDNATFAGQPACVVEPSADQPPVQGMAQLMVRYPTPIELPSGRYEFFVLTAHVRHLSAIAATVSFV